MIFLMALLLDYLILGEQQYFWITTALIIALYLFILLYGSLQIKSNYFVSSINKGNMNAISLTFDDGPHDQLTPKILDVLDAEEIKATFFVIGKKAEEHPGIIREI